jgi:ribosome-associated toxin RatA of RatAB toxin-antitoxin module
MLLSSTAHVSAQDSGFSRDERTRLRQGELVVRSEARERGQHRLIGGTSFQVIDAAPDAVWRAVLDTPRYPRFIPIAVEAREVEHSENRRLVMLRHEQGPVELSYHVDVAVHSDRKTLQFRVDRTRPGDVSEGWGFLQVRPFGENQTIVTFGIFADVGSGMVAGFFRPRLHEWMMRVPSELRRYLESGGLTRYAN